jgi:hypothetical protein
MRLKKGLLPRFSGIYVKITSARSASCQEAGAPGTEAEKSLLLLSIQ